MKLQDRDSKSKFFGATDEELIQRLREGEDGIIEFLMDKYKPLVKSKAASMFILGGDAEDLIQEGMIGLFKAIRDYDFGRDALFSTFADLCVSRQMYTAVTASGRKKHSPLNTYISLSERKDEEGETPDRPLENFLSTSEDNPETIIIGRENVEDIERAIEEELSELERQVIELYLTGLSYVQIARILSRDEKSTDNALSRAKSKLRKALLKK